MYRGALEETIDEQVLRDLRQGQDLRILVAGVPRPLGPRLGALLGILSYALEKNVAGPVHPTLARTLGYRPIVMSVRQCDTPKALIDIIMASSSTPPFTPTAHCQGRPALDGGFVDNVPVEAVADRPNKTMVLLTRRYPAEKLPKVSNRTYVQPSQDVPVGKWDYTSPDGLQAAYDLGRRDGEAFAKERVARAASSL
jgi:predicted patatin/cPLA2 family phospholipase